MKRRAVSELAAMEQELFEKVWFHRYLLSQYKDKTAQKEKFKEEDHPGFQLAQEIISKYGTLDLGPYTDFELGVLHGKLAALRWAMGDVDDNYDT